MNKCFHHALVHSKARFMRVNEENTLTAIKRLRASVHWKLSKVFFWLGGIKLDCNIVPKANLQIFGFNAEFSSSNSLATKAYNRHSQCKSDALPKSYAEEIVYRFEAVYNK